MDIPPYKFKVYVLKKINVLMYMCSRRFYNVLQDVSGCLNLGSSYEDKKKILSICIFCTRNKCLTAKLLTQGFKKGFFLSSIADNMN